MSVGNKGVLLSIWSKEMGLVYSQSVDACMDLSQLCPFSGEESGTLRLIWQRYCGNACRMKNLILNLQDQGRTLVHYFISQQKSDMHNRNFIISAFSGVLSSFTGKQVLTIIVCSKYLPFLFLSSPSPLNGLSAHELQKKQQVFKQKTCFGALFSHVISWYKNPYTNVFSH